MQSLQSYVATMNVARFAKMAVEEECPEKRGVLERLLAEAWARLAEAPVQEREPCPRSRGRAQTGLAQGLGARCSTLGRHQPQSDHDPGKFMPSGDWLCQPPRGYQPAEPILGEAVVPEAS